ncbi:MAG: hypothetical protein B6A08_16640 [Sorangiineae bacterium NIC37A_2]|jgi:cell division protein FtsB|nr:MAG: hypothetical protein B6A08_16640 [Sorangiineae bacterium NIC37A_2]
MSTFQKYRVQGIVLGLLMPSLVVAALELPHTFKSGEVISASEMNENFEALREKIEALEASQKELEEEVAALRANAPAAVDLSLTKTAEEAIFELRQNVRMTGTWPAVVNGNAQPVPSPGLYRISVEIGVRSPETLNPYTHSLTLTVGTFGLPLYATRWSGSTTDLADHRNTLVVRIEDPANEHIKLSSNTAGTTTSNLARMIIERIGD